MRSKRRNAAFAGLILLLSGCIGGAPGGDERGPFEPEVDFSHLDGRGAAVFDVNDTRRFQWFGTLFPGVSAPVVGSGPQPSPLRTFEVDESVGYVEAALEHDGSGLLMVALLDEEGRFACSAVAPGSGEHCTAILPANTTGVKGWTARVSLPGGLVPTAQTQTVSYQLRVTLHPPHHLPTPDISEELDPSIRFRIADTGVDGGEPTIGITSDGTLFTVAGTTTLRSTDGGLTWEDVTPPATTTSLDPMLYVDPWTDRVYVDHLWVGCSFLWWSDDLGETWLHNPAACGTPANDHQKIAVGGHFLPSPLYDGVVYYSYNSFSLLAPGAAALWVSRSLDGGLAWESYPAVQESIHFPYRTGGPIAADRGGNVYVPMYLSDGDFGVAVSNDHGVTWKPVRAGKGGAGNEGIDPGLAIDAVGNAYGAYWGPEGVRVVASRDHGKTWSTERTVSAAGLKSFVLADATAGDEGRVAVAYLATEGSDRGPNRADGWSRWHLYVSVSTNALDENATWNTTRVTPEDDPVQIGTICTSGIGCAGGNRNLLDFIDIQPGPDGRVHVVYTDGCRYDEEEKRPCTSPQESRSDRVVVAVQEEGQRLFADKAPWDS